eukprot:gene21821-26258_t
MHATKWEDGLPSAKEKLRQGGGWAQRKYNGISCTVDLEAPPGSMLWTKAGNRYVDCGYHEPEQIVQDVLRWQRCVQEGRLLRLPCIRYINGECYRHGWELQ